MDFGLSVVPQNVASLFLQSDYMQPHLERMRRKLKDKRDKAVEALRKELPDLVSFTVPDGGLHLWCKIHSEVNDALLLEESIRRGVVFVPGSVYGSDSGYVRFTFGRAKADEVIPGLSRFAEALRSVLAKNR